MKQQTTMDAVADTDSQCEALLTIIISPSHLAHTMDKRTRANGNGDIRA